ncbi:MAG: hypothetical protein SOI13_00955 [Bifidobacterium mongoliense]|jgi:hypothetical protein|uniref:hypothetical protein n=1 Tax=Bifidobacterium mongoliense TaxID=518643 RepID=UPI002F35628E
MQETYGLEADNLLLLEHRSWRWLERRVTGLLAVNGRLRHVLEAERDDDHG